MPLVLSKFITNPIRSVSLALLLVNVDQPLDIISALVTCASRANEVTSADAYDQDD
jgi:hypothetical protein